MDQSRSLWDLAVLSLLYERPMHPYEMQRVLRERHKDEILGLKRGSLYHAIGRLERQALIGATDTSRSGNRPERTTYAITSAGEEQLFVRLQSLIAEPRWTPTEFMASVSFLVYLGPEAAAKVLEQRLANLDEQIEELGRIIESAMPFAGRVNLLETEYARGMQIAERTWVHGILEDLRAGRLDWDIDATLATLREQARAKGADQ